MTDEEYQLELLERLCIEEPWTPITYGDDGVCMFCGSNKSERRRGDYELTHRNDCVWIEAMDYLGREHPDHLTEEVEELEVYDAGRRHE